MRSFSCGSKITRRLLTAALAGLMALSLASCGGGSAPAGSSAAPAESSAAPAESGTAPAKSSATPAESSAAPADASKPAESAAAPAKSVKGELTVSAAASLTDAMKELGEVFNKTNPDLKISFNYGSSGKLQQQIEQGAPVDLFISAGQKQMNALEEKDLVNKGTRVDLLRNEVVLIEPADSKLGLKDFKDVTKDDVKMIAIGDSGVPVGQYSEEIFKHLGIWDQVKAKANLGSDVRAVLAWVEQGEADCGVVYASDAAITDKVKVVATAPADSHKPVVYPAAVMKNAANADQAKAFLDFLKTPEAGKIFEKYGFKLA